MEMNWATIYLALGSNIEPRARYLQQALNLLLDHPLIRLDGLSSIFETAPVGVEDQPCFLNMVAAGRTALSADRLLHTTQAVEQKLGRVRTVRWGPRTIDIDILLYDRISLKAKHLELPHPRMTERAFVLIPLAELSSQLLIPGHEEPVCHLLRRINGEGVRKWRKKLRFGADGYVHFES